MSQTPHVSGGIGFAGMLTIVFIVLKLTHAINWSWWWVLSPLWVGFAAAIALFALVFLIAMVVLKIQAKKTL